MVSIALCPSLLVALIASFGMCAAYVGCLYVCASHQTKNGRRGPDRDDPSVIKERFARVGVACLIGPAIAFAAVAIPSSSTCSLTVSPLQWFGLVAADVRTLLLATFLPLVLTMVLFIGPLFMAYLDRDPSQGVLSMISESLSELSDLKTVRNLVVGPISEEWVFRACMCPLLHAAGLGDGSAVFVSGGIFGLAHVHHVFDAGTPWIGVAVQFTYTSLFGAYSSYLFLRTGVLYGAVLAHAFCNCMGLPNFGAALKDRTIGVAFVVGLSSFAALCTLDAVYRPSLFASVMWNESSA